MTQIGLGCAGMSGLYGPSDDEQSLATIRHALDRGVRLLDTAEMYGAGHNERLIGRAIAGRQAVVATKFGTVNDPAGMRVLGVDARPERVRGCAERSLRNLGVDAIDIYYLQRMDPNVPIEETAGAMAELVRDGLVRALGLCEAPAATLRRAHAVHPIDYLQSEYSLWWRGPEAELLPACEELGVTFVAYSPLGRGLLGGAIKRFEDLPEGDNRRRHPRFIGENLDRNLELVTRLEAVAGAKGCTVAQLALAWLLARGVTPLIGTKRAAHIDENLVALDVELTPGDLAAIDAAAPAGAGAGARYHSEGARFVPR